MRQEKEANAAEQQKQQNDVQQSEEQTPTAPTDLELERQMERQLKRQMDRVRGHPSMSTKPVAHEIPKPASQMYQCGEIPSYSGLERLGLQLCDIKFNVRFWDEENDDMTDFPPLSPSVEDANQWSPTLVTFVLPLSQRVRDVLGEDSGLQEISKACVQIWRLVDGIPETTQFTCKALQGSVTITIWIKGWARAGFPNSYRTMQGNHAQGRTIWACNLPLELCRNLDNNLSLWPGDQIHKWLSVSITYSYRSPAKLAGVMYTEEEPKTLSNLQERLTERAQEDRISFLGRLPINHHNLSLRDEIFAAGPPVIDLAFIETDRGTKFATITYHFRAPRDIVIAVFDRGEDRFADLDLFLSGWGDTVRDTIQAERSHKPFDPERRVDITVEVSKGTLTKTSSLDLVSLQQTRPVSKLQLVMYEIHVSLTRLESSLLDYDRFAFEEYANGLLCLFRHRIRLQKGRETLCGEMKLFPTELVILIKDWARDEVKVSYQRTVEMPPVVSYIARPELIGGKCPWLLPGLPDFEFPLTFHFKHKEIQPKAPTPGEKSAGVSSRPQTPPPEEAIPACLDLMQELYGMIGEHLDTLQAMEKEFPDRMKELRQNAEEFYAKDFHLDIVTTKEAKDMTDMLPQEIKDSLLPQRSKQDKSNESVHVAAEMAVADATAIVQENEPTMPTEEDFKTEDATDIENITSDISQLDGMGVEYKVSVNEPAETPPLRRVDDQRPPPDTLPGRLEMTELQFAQFVCCLYVIILVVLLYDELEHLFLD
jgi:hypothetical protein